MEEIVLFLRQGKFHSFVLKSLAWEKKIPSFLLARALSSYGLIRGYFSFGEWARLLLPPRYKSERLREKFSIFLSAETKVALASFIRPDDAVILYGKPVYPPGGNYYELTNLLLEVVALDQYQTRHYLRSGDIVIDAGANIGIFLIFAAQADRDVTVHAFEPARRTFELLKRNTIAYPNIFCYQNGLGDSIGRKKLFATPHSMAGDTMEDSGMLSIRHSRPEELKSEEVDITTIDRFVTEQRVTKVDFIKIDSEGYEARILQGAETTIRKFQPVIVMSAYHHPGDDGGLSGLVQSFSRGYVCELKKDYEADLICYPKGRTQMAP